MARQLALMERMLEGPDIEEIQRLLGFTGAAVDGVYGEDTAAAVEEWKWRVGYPADKINSVLGLIGLSLLKGDVPFPRDFKTRAKAREGLPFGAKKAGRARRPTTAGATTRASTGSRPAGARCGRRSTGRSSRPSRGSTTPARSSGAP